MQSDFQKEAQHVHHRTSRALDEGNRNVLHVNGGWKRRDAEVRKARNHFLVGQPDRKSGDRILQMSDNENTSRNYIRILRSATDRFLHYQGLEQASKNDFHAARLEYHQQPLCTRRILLGRQLNKMGFVYPSVHEVTIGARSYDFPKFRIKVFHIRVLRFSS